jgi:hypothetical protein
LCSNLASGKAFFEKLKKNKGIVELPSGLRHEILQPGTGVYPTAADTVTVHYTGKLLNDTVFDSSAQHGKPMETQLNRVIPGWTEGLQKINRGGKIRLYVPSKLAYGDSGHPGIPPGATLVFDVELIDVKSAHPAPVARKNDGRDRPRAPHDFAMHNLAQPLRPSRRRRLFMHTTTVLPSCAKTPTVSGTMPNPAAITMITTTPSATARF